MNKNNSSNIIQYPSSEPKQDKNLAIFLSEIYKPFAKYLEQENLNEIMVNEPGFISIEQTIRKKQVMTTIADENITRQAIEQMTQGIANETGQKFNAKSPVLYVTMPGYGHRIRAVCSPLIQANLGAAFAIRAQLKQDFQLKDFLNKKQIKQTKDLLTANHNLIICGKTSSGKTALFNTMLKHTDQKLRIISTENTYELQIPHKNKVSLLYSEIKKVVTYETIISTINTMRPDKVLFGELTSESTPIFARILYSGHQGLIATTHAASREETLHNLALSLIQYGFEYKNTKESLERKIKAVFSMHRNKKGQRTAKIELSN